MWDEHLDWTQTREPVSVSPLHLNLRVQPVTGTRWDFPQLCPLSPPTWCAQQYLHRGAERLPQLFGLPLRGRTPLTGLSSPVCPAEEEVKLGRHTSSLRLKPSQENDLRNLRGFIPKRLCETNFSSVVFVFYRFCSSLSWFAPPIHQHVCPDEPEDVDDLPHRAGGLSGAGDQHGDLDRVGVPDAVRDERLWDGAVPGSDAAGRAAAVLRPHAAADDTAAYDAAGGLPGVPAESATPERQQPGVRPDVPAAEHDRGEPHVPLLLLVQSLLKPALL